MVDLVFQQSPDVVIGSNTFRRVPVILQYFDTPLLEVVKSEDASYGTRLNVFYSDGIKIAVVKGNQIYPTEEGKKANLKMRFEPNLTAIELEGKPILELRREGAAALKGMAELYTPDGALIKVHDAVSGLLKSGEALEFKGVVFKGMTIEDSEIGILVDANGLSVGRKNILRRV